MPFLRPGLSCTLLHGAVKAIIQEVIDEEADEDMAARDRYGIGAVSCGIAAVPGPYAACRSVFRTVSIQTNDRTKPAVRPPLVVSQRQLLQQPYSAETRQRNQHRGYFNGLLSTLKAAAFSPAPPLRAVPSPFHVLQGSEEEQRLSWHPQIPDFPCAPLQPAALPRSLIPGYLGI